MKGQCDICNRKIEAHLVGRGKRLCFACLVEEVSEAGALPTFKIKEKPMQAPCGVCGGKTTGGELQSSPWGFICGQCRALAETQTGFQWGRLSLSAQKEWLVRSMKKILGPFTTDEVSALLQENRVVALDEICQPEGRWSLIRDNDTFRFILNEIRNKRASQSGENTQTGTATDFVTSSITSSYDSNPFAKKAEAPVKPAPVNPSTPVREVQPLAEPASPSSRDLVKSYAYEEDPHSMRRSTAPRKHSPFLWVAALFCIFSLGLVIFRQNHPPLTGSARGGTTFQEVMTAALKAERVGNYRKALDSFKEAQNLKPRDPELLLHLAPLELVYDLQLLEAQRMFKLILESEQGVNYKKAAQVGLGLIALENHEYDNAWESFLAAVKMDPDFTAAVGNMGVVEYFRGKLPEAEALLYKSLDKGADGAFALALGDVAMALAADRKDRAKLRAAHEMLSAYINYMHDYQQEALIADARILTLLDKDSEAAQRIEQYLDTDPDQTELHTRDWTVYRGRVSWDLLLESYKKVVSKLSSSARLSAGLGLAMYKSREKIDGAQTIEQALHQSVSDPLLLALAGWVQLKLGNREQGLMNIRESVKNDATHRLPFILAARACEEEKDFECARKHWLTVQKLSRGSVQAMTGLAGCFYQQKNFDQAMNLAKQALAADPTFIPALALVQVMQPQSEGK